MSIKSTVKTDVLATYKIPRDILYKKKILATCMVSCQLKIICTMIKADIIIRKADIIKKILKPYRCNAVI